MLRQQILVVKQRIEAAYGHEAEWQKLIFAGKILVDDQTVESYNITERDFLVLMVRKVRPHRPILARTRLWSAMLQLVGG